MRSSVPQADAFEIVVVEDDDLAVLRQLDVQLHAVAGGGGQLESLEGILRHAPVAAVQAAMGEVAAPEGRFLSLGRPSGREQEDRQRDCRRAAGDQDLFGFFHIILLSHRLQEPRDP